MEANTSILMERERVFCCSIRDLEDLLRKDSLTCNSKKIVIMDTFIEKPLGTFSAFQRRKINKN